MYVNYITPLTRAFKRFPESKATELKLPKLPELNDTPTGLKNSPLPKELNATESNDARSKELKPLPRLNARTRLNALKHLPKLPELNDTPTGLKNSPLPKELNATESNDARSKELKATPRLNGFCSRILMPKQVGGICWFTTTFVAMFYSQRSRKILQEASKYWKWDEKNESEVGVFNLFKEILNDKYMKKNMNDAEYKKLIDNTFKDNDETFEDILKNLHELDKNSFPFNPSIHPGYTNETYIGRLYNLLNVNYKVFDYNKKDHHLFYSYLNIELFDTYKFGLSIITHTYSDFQYKEYKDNIDIPEILMVFLREDDNSEFFKQKYPNTIIGKGDTRNNITSMNDEILYRGRKYHLDSVIVRNFNETEGVLSIVGITCKKNKYVYNGLERKSRDPAMKNLPCGLMSHDWKIKGNEESGDRCINIHHDKRVCFNFSKGFRTLVYVLAENGFCSRILMPKQVGGICWFTTTFVAMFYSQRSRKILQEASKYWKWDEKNESEVGVFNLFKEILNDKYMKKNMNDAEYKKLIDNTFKDNDETFEDILKNLHELDKNSFPFNPSIHPGYTNETYIGRLYNLLNVNYKVFDYNKKDHHLFYSYLNIELFDTYKFGLSIITHTYSDFQYKEYKDNIDIPEILMVFLREDDNSEFFKQKYPNTIIGKGDTRNNITSMNDEILYRGRKYHLDSVLLADWKKNGGKPEHAIVGITCKQERYVYNGWTRESKDPTMKDLPCGLMLHDWKIKGDEESGDRCINTNNCTMDPNLQHHKLCFNFSKGSRTLVYVLAENRSVTSNSLSRSPAIKKISL